MNSSPRRGWPSSTACAARSPARGVHVGLELTGDLDALPPGVELSCYRIVQEALTNTLKHSGARNARVSVCGANREVTVRVCDDGRGQAPAGSASGFLLKDIRSGQLVEAVRTSPSASRCC